MTDPLDIASTRYIPPSREELAKAHDKAKARGADCDNCALFGCRRGPVMGDVRPNARLVIVGEAPGKNEVEEGRVFIGASGVELDESLERGGLERKDCTITNTILCRPPPHLSFDMYTQQLRRDYEKAAEAASARGEPIPPVPKSPIECCRPRLIRDIEESNAKAYLAVGGQGLAQLAHYFGLPYAKGKDVLGQTSVANIMNQHGSPISVAPTYEEVEEIETKNKETGKKETIRRLHTRQRVTASGRVLKEPELLLSSLHPAFAMRGAKSYKYVIRDDITRAATIVSRGNKIDWTEPTETTFIYTKDAREPEEQVDEILAVLDEFVCKATSVTVDIETDSKDTQHCQIRCIGLGARINGVEKIIVVPLRHMHGTAFWARKFHEDNIRTSLRHLFDRCKLVFHNGMFDTTVLLREGLMTNTTKSWVDTLVAHHDTDHSDLPHKLGFVAARFLEVPMWKNDVDHKFSGNTEREHDLHVYNAKDIVTTMRLAPILVDRIASVGTLNQFQIDTNLLPIAREMGRLGCFIDEHKRGDLSFKFNKLTDVLRKKFQAIVGKDINPNSSHQVSEWLFHEKGYVPVVATSGKDYKDGDKAAVSMPALVRLPSQNALDEQTKKAIEVLMQFKACEKIRSTYLDNVRCDPVPELAQSLAEVVSYMDRDILPERPDISVLHPTWKLYQIPTGRWSSSPNVQNVPARAWALDRDDKGQPVSTNLRKLFIAPPGHVIVGADMKQVELRLYAYQAQDQLLLKAFRDGLDAHTINAASLFSEDQSIAGVMREYERIENMEKGMRKYLRTVAKRFAFLEIYGGEEDKLYSVMAGERDKATNELVFPNIKPKDCEVWHKRWHKLHPETKAWQKHRMELERQRGWEETMFSGRRRFWPGGPDKVNAVPNHGIQGCLPASTRVLTEFGYVPIGDLLNKKFRAWTGNAWADAQVVRRGTDRRVQLKLSDGKTVVVDTRHRVKTPTANGYEWKSVMDLRRGDQVALSLSEPLEFGALTMTSDDAWMLGFYIANGHITKHTDRGRDNKYNVTMTVGHRHHASLFSVVERIVRWGETRTDYASVVWKRNHARTTKNRARYASIIWTRRSFVEFFERLGATPNETAHTKRVPETIWRSNLIVRRAFLHGYLTAEAYVRTNVSSSDKVVSVNSCNKLLLEDIHLLAQTVGIDSSLSGPYKADRAGHFAFRIRFQRNQIFRELGIGVAARQRGGELAPKFEARKLLELDRRSVEQSYHNSASASALYQRIASGGTTTIQQLRLLGVRPKYGLARVRSIEVENVTEPMFTLSVQHQDHEYVAESLISKNSSGDITNEAILKVNEEIPFGKWSKYTGLWMNCHDYIAVYVPDSRADEAKKIIMKCMHKSVPGMEFPPDDPKATRNWADQD